MPCVWGETRERGLPRRGDGAAYRTGWESWASMHAGAIANLRGEQAKQYLRRQRDTYSLNLLVLRDAPF